MTKQESSGRGAVDFMGQALGSAFRSVGLSSIGGALRRRPGAPPGLERAPDVGVEPEELALSIDCIDYGPERVEAREIDDLDAFLAEPRPQWASVRWVNVVGLQPFTINRFRESYGFHTLAAEDVVALGQRAKVEPYEDHVFFVWRMMMLADERLIDEQIGVFLFRDTILTFQERTGDVWDPVRQRLEVESSRLRRGGAGYLAYALFDAIVDHFFPILERMGDVLEEIEAEMVDDPAPSALERLYRVKRELVLLRRTLWPMRQVADEFQRIEAAAIDDQVRTYLRDVHDHAAQVIDFVETYREMAAALADLYMTSLSNRMNEVMKTLTIMASLFIPVTFLAGVYGMNFERIPELSWSGAYPVFWALCVANFVGLLYYFRKRGWLGS